MLFRKLALVLATSISFAILLDGCTVDWTHAPSDAQSGQVKRSR